VLSDSDSDIGLIALRDGNAGRADWPQYVNPASSRLGGSRCPVDHPLDGEQDPDTWLDHDAGPMVRSFAVTGAGSAPERPLDLLAYVVTTTNAPNGSCGRSSSEHRRDSLR